MDRDLLESLVITGVLIATMGVGVVIAVDWATATALGVEKRGLPWAQVFPMLDAITFSRRGKEWLVTGRLGEYAVEVSPSLGGEPLWPTVFTRLVILGADIGRLLSLCDHGSSLQPNPDGIVFENPETGDWGFDGTVRVWDTYPMARAALNAPTRRCLTRLIGMGAVAVQRGRLCLLVRGSLEAVSPRLEAVLALCLDAAGRLSVGRADASEALAASAESDPEPEVRRRSLEVLGQHYGGTAVARRAGTAALCDEVAGVRITAATLVPGPDAYACLTCLVDERSGRSGAVRARALAAVVQGYPPADQCRLLGRALQSWEEPLQRVAAEAIASLPEETRLEHLFADAGFDEAGLVAAVGHSESSLVAMLCREAMESQRAAARALGGVGTLGAVEPLRRLAANPRLDREVRRAAREAFRRIQERLGAGGGGGLSLARAATLAGALSVPNTARP